MSNNIILCGYHWAGCRALEVLIQGGYNIFVYTHEADKNVPSLIKLCKEYNINYSTENISQSNLPFTPDVICSVYYRNIIKKHIIDSCNGRIFNLHPSLLPKYRGCSSIPWAIINNEKETGFTYHYIDEGCDTGKIIFTKNISISSFETALTLYYRIMFVALEYFRDVLQSVFNNYKGSEQIGTSSLYKRGVPYNGIIDPNWTEDKIKRFIRAMYFPPYPPATYKNIPILSFEEYQKYGY